MAEITSTDQSGVMMYSGLENFLWKLSIPNTPSYNINTDLKFQVHLWFHNGNGAILSNPFLDTKRFKNNFQFKEQGHIGIQETWDPNERAGDGLGLQLSDKCFDLTPFVQSIEMPDIGTTAKTEVETLLGTMQVGSFSPYSSDGGQRITFQLVDTEYSILDAIFYPWLKMIGTPKWYDQKNAMAYNLTPYPICTIEIISPRRWYPEDNVGTRTQYSFTFIGARPINYGSPSMNMEAKDSLTRKLEMGCDLVLVDMEHDSVVKKEGLGEVDPVIVNVSKNTENSSPDAPTEPPPISSDTSPEVPANPNTNLIDEKQKEIDSGNKDAEDQMSKDAPPGPEDGGNPEQTPPPEELPAEEGPADSATDGNPIGLQDFVAHSKDSDAPIGGIPAAPVEPPKRAGILKKTIVRRNVQGDHVLSLCKNIAKEQQGLLGDSHNTLSSKSLKDSISIESFIAQNSSTLGNSDVVTFASRISNSMESLSDIDIKIVKDFNEDVLLTRTTSLPDPAPRNVWQAKAFGAIKDVPDESNSQLPCPKTQPISVTTKNLRTQLSDSITKSKLEAVLAQRAFYMDRMFPNNTISRTFGQKDGGAWLIGFNLTFIRNIIVESLKLPEEWMMEERYNKEPFLRIQTFRSSFTDSEKLTVLWDTIKDIEREEEERRIGDWYMEEVGVWEIVDKKHNHTGEKLVKVWLVKKNGDEITDGKIIITKLSKPDTSSYTLLPIDSFDSNIFDHPQPEIVISKPSINFCKHTHHTIFSEDDRYEIEKSGQYEFQFNPATAIRKSKRYFILKEKLVSSPSYLLMHQDEVEFDELGEYVMYERVEEQAPVRPSKRFEPILSTSDDKTTSSFQATKSYENPESLDPSIVDSLQVSHDQDLWDVLEEESKNNRHRLYAILKEGEEWESAGELAPVWKNNFTTTHHINIFQANIPSSISYIIQYDKQLARLQGMVVEQSKLKKILDSLQTKYDSYTEEFKSTLTWLDDVKNLTLIQRLMKIEEELSTISSLFTRLTESEISQERQLNLAKSNRRGISNLVNATKPTKLDKYILRNESLNLNQLEVAKIQKSLFDIRKKLREISTRYAELLEERSKLLASTTWTEEEEDDGGIIKKEDWSAKKASEFLQYVLMRAHRCMWLQRYALLLKNASLSSSEKLTAPELISRYTEFYETRDDIRKRVERLVVFFSRSIDSTSKDIESATTHDLIMFYDWIATGHPVLGQEIEPGLANTISYKLRTEVELPEKYEELYKLQKKYAREKQNFINSTKLVYDSSDEQEAVDLSQHTSNPIYIDQSAIDFYRGLFKAKVSIENSSETEPTDYVDQSTISFYKKLFGRNPTPKEPTKEEIEAKYKDALPKVLALYRKLHPSFESFSKEELKDSLLFILSSTYLKGEGSELYGKLLECRSQIETKKADLESYEVEVDKEIKMMDAARAKHASILSAINSLDAQNKKLIKANTRESKREAKINTLQKIELQSSAKEISSVVNEMLDHYNKVVKPKQDSITKTLQSARDEYSALLEELEEKIDFKDKVIFIASTI